MRLAALASAVLAALLASGAGAQESARARPAESHGWIAATALDVPGGSLLHLPPRTDTPSGPASEAGDAWLARTLSGVPRWVADWDRRAFLLFSQSRERFTVFSIDVRRPVPSGAWLTDPATGAMAEPALHLGDEEFVGAAGSAAGLLVLTRGEAWAVHRLADREWVREELPPAVAGADRVWLVEDADPPRLLASTGSTLSAWVRPEGDGAAWDSPALLTRPEGFDAERVLAVFASGQDTCVVVYGEAAEKLGVVSLGPGLVGSVAAVASRGRPIAVEPLERGRRLAVLTEVVDQDATGIDQPIREWELVEVSLVSGRELFRGEPQFPTLVLSDGVRVLSLAMMALTGCVLFYLLRPVGGAKAAVLPEGAALATPNRRLVAALFDAALVSGVVSAALHVPFSHFVLGLPLLETGRGVVALVTAVVGGAIYGTVSEWLLGRTLGKMLVGVRVVSVDPALPSPGLMRCGARNVFRWALWPWALLGLNGPDFRHRGDVVAGTAVVVEAAEPPKDG